MSIHDEITRRRALAWGGAALATLSPAMGGAAVVAPAEVATLLDSAIAGPQRSAANKARDVYRHPKETLLFFGLTPEQTVIEIAPGGGWYTEILAPVLRGRGRLYEADFSSDSKVPEEREMHSRFLAKLQRDPATYDQVRVGSMPGKRFTDIDPPGGADMVLTFRNIHNWIEDGSLNDMLGAFFAVLKPGGVLGIEEHRAPIGATLAQTGASGYVPESFVIDRCRVAGFELGGRSEINANPKDTKDYAQGVWALPPTLRGGQVDREKYLAIGESDRMTLAFVKPRLT